MSIFNFFRKKKYEDEFNNETEINKVSNQQVIELEKTTQLEFIDSSELVFDSLPITMAKDVPVNSRKIVEDKGEKFVFPLCPGMFDYSKLGYILPAWSDFHFKANKAGVVGIIGGNNKTSPFREPSKMNKDIVEGLFKIEDNIPLVPFNLNSPWKVFSYDKNISALLLPAWFHSDPELLDKFYIYPGIVDYDTFHVMNVILAARKKCEYTIKAGDPLLHIIPIYNKDIRCGYGPPTIEQKSKINYDPKIHETQFYRKNHNAKKNYKLEEPLE